MRSGVFWAIVAAMAMPAGIHAQASEPACPATPAALPPELAAWSSPNAVNAAGNLAGARQAALTVGTAATATLHPTNHIQYAAPPGKAAPADSSGGLFTFRVERVGTYRVALGTGGWIDVISDGKPVASTAHGHGPACSSIRKIVDFPLKPGLHILQIAGAPSPNVTVLLAPSP